MGRLDAIEHGCLTSLCIIPSHVAWSLRTHSWTPTIGRRRPPGRILPRTMRTWRRSDRIVSRIARIDVRLFDPILGPGANELQGIYAHCSRRGLPFALPSDWN